MNKNLLAVLIGGGALLAWSMSKAANGGNGSAACSPDLLAAGWSEIPGVGVPGETGYRAPDCQPPAGTGDWGQGPQDAGLPDDGSSGTVPGAQPCSPCSGTTPFTAIPPGGAACAGCVGHYILPPPLHFLLGFPVPIPGYWSLPDLSYGN